MVIRDDVSTVAGNALPRDRYPTKRERLIAAGLVRSYTSRPTLRLLPGERDRFEREAREWLHYDKIRERLWMPKVIEMGVA